MSIPSLQMLRNKPLFLVSDKGGMLQIMRKNDINLLLDMNEEVECFKELSSRGKCEI